MNHNIITYQPNPLTTTSSNYVKMDVNHQSKNKGYAYAHAEMQVTIWNLWRWGKKWKKGKHGKAIPYFAKPTSKKIVNTKLVTRKPTSLFYHMRIPIGSFISKRDWKFASTALVEFLILPWIPQMVF